MLDFRENPENGNFDGKLKRTFYNYITAHPNDPAVIEIKKLATNGKSLAQAYREYMQNVKYQEDTEEVAQQEFDFENNVGFSSKILDASKTLTEDELLKQHGYEPKDWKITKHQCSKWNSGNKILMSSKIFVRPRNILESSPEALMKRIDKALKLVPKNIEIVRHERPEKSKLLVLPIADLHYGLIADTATSGNCYNMETAEYRLKKYIFDAVEKANLSSDSSILITFGNDYFNCDNPAGTTAHGTPQDNEASYFTVWDKGVQLAISIVDYLKDSTAKEVPIFVASVQGNHDLQSSHALLLALHYKYLNSDKVFVVTESDESARWYFSFGKNLLGFAHDAKIQDCHRMMSSECENWSKCDYRTMFLAHLHKEEVLDTGALVVRRVPTLSGNSTWATGKGFVTSPRGQAFIFNKSYGLEEIINITIPA